MSHRHKQGIKRLAYHLREEEKEFWKTFERKPLSQFPRAAAVLVLANPLAKSTNARRSRIRRALSSAILVPRQQPRDPAVKLTQDLQRVPLSRLINLIKHSARHASTFKHLAEKVKEGTTIHQNLLAAQTFHLGVLRQARSEYNVRTQPTT